MRRSLPILLLMAGLLGAPLLRPAHAEEAKSIVLKAMLVNPATKPQNVPVELPLPREVTKRNVLDLAEGLRVVYDAEQGVYKALGEVTLGPSEQRMIEVRLEDIWQVPESEIQFQKGYLPSLLTSLAKTKYAETAAQLGGTIASRLDRILESQRQAVSPSKHIAIYRENLSVMNEVKKDVRFLEKLTAERTPLPKELLETESDQAFRGEPADAIPTITLRMRVQNPSKTERALVPVEYYLPREVQEKDVINASDLDVRYDLTRGAVYLYKAEVALEPDETKVYEVVLRDLWRVEPDKVQVLEVKTAGLAQGLEGTVFQKSAVKLAKEIEELAKQIVENQAKAERQPLEERIAVYVENLGLVAEMREKMTTVARLEAVQTTSPETKPEQLGFPGPMPEATLQADKTALRGPKILAKTIFQGKAPDPSTVWRVIFSIVIFLGFISLLFYLVWWKQVSRPSALDALEK